LVYLSENIAMKTLSLKLDNIIFEETEELLDKIKKSRNRYINEAIQHYNQIQKKKLIEQLLIMESKLVSDESMKILNEFENLEDYDR
jgi:metal-responsive CopG/Arc/MetJ family transcriptional regulator